MFKEKIRTFASYVLLLISISALCFSCNSREEADSIKIESIDKFISSYNFIKSDEKQKQQRDSVGKLIKALPNSDKTRDLLVKFLGETGADQSFIDLLFTYAREVDDTQNEAKAYLMLGRSYEKRYITDTAFYNYTKAEFLYKKTNDTLNLKETYVLKSIILLNNGIYAEAQSTILNLMKLNDAQKDLKNEYIEKLFMGTALTGLGDFDEAINSLNDALKLLDAPVKNHFYKPDQRRLNKVTVHNSIIETYIKQGEYNKAELLANELLENYIVNDNPYDSQLYANTLFLQSKALLLQEKYENIENNLQMALEIQTKYSNHRSINASKMLLSELYYLTNRNNLASNLIVDVLTYAEKSKDLTLEKEALSKLLKYDQTYNRNNFMRYEQIGELIIDENNLIKNTFARISFEADSLLKVNKQLQSQKDVITQVGSGMLFIVTIIFFIVLFKQKSHEVSMVKLFQSDTEKYYDSILTIQNKLVEARVLERKEVAKELHDGVLNKLFVTRFSLMQINAETLESQRNLLVNEVQEVEKYIRDVSHAFANEESFEIGFFSQLIEDLVEVQNRNINTKFSLVISPELDLQKLSHRTKVHIYRIVQEALQNVHKYANANKCLVAFSSNINGEIEILIEDDGVGFKMSAVKKGLGLNSIQDRCNLINGEFTIKSILNKGTTLHIIINDSKTLEPIV